MVERQLPKLDTRVRFPSPAPSVYNQLLTLCTTCQDSEVGKSVGKLPPKFTSFLRCFRCLSFGESATLRFASQPIDTVVPYLYPLSIRRSMGEHAKLLEIRRANRAVRHPDISDRRGIGFKREFRQREHLLAFRCAPPYS